MVTIKKADATHAAVQAQGTEKQRAPHDLTKLLSAEEQQMIGTLIKKEKAAAQASGQSSSFERPGSTRATPGDHPIAARYLVPPPVIVARYLVIPPWGTHLDTHVALINKVTKDHRVTKVEAQSIRKIFNHDIADAKRRGEDIKSNVQKYLEHALKGCKLSEVAKKAIFGEGGPGHKGGQVYYILPPPGGPGGTGGGGHVYYILPPR